MDPIIKTGKDLKDEIYRLQALEKQQAAVLANRFSSPAAVFSSVISLFTNTSGPDVMRQAGLFKQDFVTLISRFVLPFTLNRTIFRKSNFLIKALVGLLAQRASKYINEKNVGSVWEKTKHLFEDSGTQANFIGKIKALFEGKPAKKSFNHPTAPIPAKQNILKPV